MRAEPLHGGPGGGRRGYVYGLSSEGAEVLATLADIPIGDIPTVAGREALEPRYVNHQLTVNRCLLAIRQACRAHSDAALCEWTADPHPRVRYRVGRAWRTVHPDAVAELTVDGQRRWTYLEVDRGTAELRRCGLKLRRYARFYLSGSWQHHYDRIPEVRIVAAHRLGCCAWWQRSRMLCGASARLTLARWSPAWKSLSLGSRRSWHVRALQCGHSCFVRTVGSVCCRRQMCWCGVRSPAVDRDGIFG